MIKYEWYRAGTVFGMRYQIPKGESISRHKHDASMLHNVIVLAGKVLFDGDESRYLNVGTVYDFDGSKPHQITAVEDAVTLHIFLNGMPREYGALPVSEHSGTF